MSEPIAICLEDLDATDDARRYLRCTALGEADGLCLDAAGAVHWRRGRPLLELCVSGDEQLLLYLPAGAGYEAVLSRDGRSLVLPPGRPVEVLDQDLLELGGRRLRIHVHGVAAAVHPPRWLDPSPEPDLSPEPRQGPGRALTAATALAVGAALGAGACDEPQHPPAPKKTTQAVTKKAPPQPDARPPAKPDAAALKPDAAPPRPDAAPLKRVIKRKKKIKVRIRPPAPLPSDDPLGGL